MERDSLLRSWLLGLDWFPNFWVYVKVFHWIGWAPLGLSSAEGMTDWRTGVLLGADLRGLAVKRSSSRRCAGLVELWYNLGSIYHPCGQRQRSRVSFDNLGNIYLSCGQRWKLVAKFLSWAVIISTVSGIFVARVISGILVPIDKVAEFLLGR